MNLIFYNHYANGDLFESREFVRDWMRLAGATTARYAMRHIPGFFADLPQIEQIEVTPDMDMRAGVTRRGDDLLVNTWIGARGGYVVDPGIGCTVEGLYRMHNDLLREAGLPPLPRTVAEYLPVIDYTRVYLDPRLKSFVDFHRHMKLVLVCNGPCTSGQAANFNLAGVLEHLPVREDVVYLLTQSGHGQNRPDVYDTDDLTGRQGCASDLNAISYLSRFCSLIVGRCSGPHVAAQVMENWMDSTKTLVGFTHNRNGACFVLDPSALGLRMKVRHSPVNNPADAAAFLEALL